MEVCPLRLTGVFSFCRIDPRDDNVPIIQRNGFGPKTVNHKMDSGEHFG